VREPFFLGKIILLTSFLQIFIGDSMVIIFRKGSNFQLSLLDANAEKLGLKPNAEYELIELTKGVFALVERRHGEKALDRKIFSMLKERKLSERVEGKFEKLLNSEELKRFNELIKEGKIIPFRLSEKYKKAVYKLAEELKGAGGRLAEAARRQEQAQEVQRAAPEKQALVRAPKQVAEPKEHLQSITVPSFDEMELAKHDFAIVKDENVARTLSTRLSNEIRKREVLGTRTFDGEYYIIKKTLYDKFAPVLLQYIKEHTPASAEQIASDLNIDKSLVKVVCEFLREEGEITEKRRELYEYVF